MNNLEVYELHKYKEQYLKQCVKLLNSQWPKNKEARLLSLESSCDKLPTSLILVYKKKVVGHSKISRILSIPNACMIESVMVQKRHRGKGWGKFLMEETENYIKRFDMNYIYLTTSDKAGFYEKLGYKLTEPIPLFGNPILMPVIHQMRETLLSSITNCMCNSQQPTTPVRIAPKNNEPQVTGPPPPPPPPPPPLPPPKTNHPKSKKDLENAKKVYMIKCLKY